MILFIHVQVGHKKSVGSLKENESVNHFHQLIQLHKKNRPIKKARMRKNMAQKDNERNTCFTAAILEIKTI